MSKLNIPIRYFGGKGGMYKQIIKYFPKTYDTYIEPFGGSFSVGIRKGITPVEIYNDIDYNLYSLYKVLSDSFLFKEFKHMCDLIYYHESIREDSKQHLKNDLSMVQRAFHFFVVNRMSHNGVGGFSKNLVVRRNISKSVSDMLSTIDGLEQFHQRMSKVVVCCRDALELIKKYDGKDNTLFYLDPPYHHSTRTNARYRHDFTNKQYKELIDLLINCKSKYLISGYNCEQYKKLEENGFERIDFKVNTIDGKRKPKEKIESLWRNYDIST